MGFVVIEVLLSFKGEGEVADFSMTGADEVMAYVPK